MDTQLHSMSHLFAQLGLPADQESIHHFIASHRPLENSVALHQASFWSSAQSCFLEEEIIEDADWAPVIDTLNGLLRQ